MKNINTLQDIKNDLKNQIEKTKAIKEAWQHVKRQYKKDGGIFADRGKNFYGAKFGLYTPNEDAMHPYLTIFYNYKIKYNETNTQYFNHLQDQLQCFKYWRDMTEEEKQNKTPIKYFYNEIYIFSYDEIEEAIKKYILELEETIKDYETQFKNTDKIVKQADKMINNIKKLFKDNENILQKENTNNKIKYNNSLCWDLINYIQNNLQSHKIN